MIVHLTLKSAQHSSQGGWHLEPELRGNPFESITIDATTGGAVIVNLHTVEQANALLDAVAEAASRIRGRAAAKQAAE